MTQGPESQFLEFLRGGKFMLQRNNDTGACIFYPRYCVDSDNWDWIEASGEGTIYSVTVVRQKPERGGDFCVGIVELSEGPRIVARIRGIDPSTAFIGMPVVAAVEAADWDWKDTPVVSFYPASARET